MSKRHPEASYETHCGVCGAPFDDNEHKRTPRRIGSLGLRRACRACVAEAAARASDLDRRIGARLDAHRAAQLDLFPE